MATPFELGACTYPPIFVAGLLPHELRQPEPLHALTTSVLIDGRLFVTCGTCGWTRELFTLDVPQTCGVERQMREARRVIEREMADVVRVVAQGEREAEHLGRLLRELAS